MANSKVTIKSAGTLFKGKRKINRSSRLTAWDVALIDQQLTNHLATIPDDQSIYKACVAALVERITKADHIRLYS